MIIGLTEAEQAEFDKRVAATQGREDGALKSMIAHDRQSFKAVDKIMGPEGPSAESCASLKEGLDGRKIDVKALLDTNSDLLRLTEISPQVHAQKAAALDAMSQEMTRATVPAVQLCAAPAAPGK